MAIYICSWSRSLNYGQSGAGAEKKNFGFATLNEINTLISKKDLLLVHLLKKSYLCLNLLGLILHGLEEESDLRGLAPLVQEDAGPPHLRAQVLTAGQHQPHVVSQEHTALSPGKKWN